MNNYAETSPIYFFLNELSAWKINVHASDLTSRESTGLA